MAAYQMVNLLHGLIRKSHFPQVADAENAQKKLNFLRLCLGLVLVCRMTYVTFAAYHYYDPELIAGIPVPPEFLASVGYMGLVVLFAAGFLTPLVTLLLIPGCNLFNEFLMISNLGTNILTMVLIYFLLANGGSRYSVDSVLLRREIPVLSGMVRKVYGTIGFPSAEQLTLYAFLLFSLYALISVAALGHHLQDLYWLQGQTIQVLLVNAYTSRYYAFFRHLEAIAPQFLSAFSWAGTIGQTLFQALMLPLVFTRWGRNFVVTWGLLFFLISLLLLQLSYLPYIELCLWGLVFLPASSDNRIRILYDDRCNLCQGSVRFLDFIDIIHRYEFCPMTRHSAMASQYGIEETTLQESLHGIYEQQVFQGYDLYLLLARKNPLLVLLYPLLWLFKITHIGPAIYGWVARNRYRFTRQCSPAGSEETRTVPPKPQQSTGFTAGLLIAYSAILLIFIAPPALLPFGHLKNSVLVYAGLIPPNVFNKEDLSTGNYWVVINRHKDGEASLVPLSGPNGGRRWYHLLDPIYFGNHLRWRRLLTDQVHAVEDVTILDKQGRPLESGEKKRLVLTLANQPGYPGYEYLRDIIQYDFRLNGEGDMPDFYQVDIYRNRTSRVALTDLRYRYKPELVYSFRLSPDQLLP